MPQFTLEYTSNITQPIDFQALFANFHGILSEQGGVRIKNCKSRAVRRDEFRIGAGEANGAFVHVDLLLAEGRSQDWMQRIGGALLAALEAMFEPSKQILDLQITLYIRDLRRERYFKYPAGTLTPLAELDAAN